MIAYPTSWLSLPFNANSANLSGMNVRPYCVDKANDAKVNIKFDYDGIGDATNACPWDRSGNCGSNRFNNRFDCIGSVDAITWAMGVPNGVYGFRLSSSVSGCIYATTPLGWNGIWITNGFTSSTAVPVNNLGAGIAQAQDTFFGYSTRVADGWNDLAGAVSQPRVMKLRSVMPPIPLTVSDYPSPWIPYATAPLTPPHDAIQSDIAIESKGFLERSDVAVAR